jgi:hypothetical protein
VKAIIAFTGATDLTLTVGSGSNTFFTASGSLNMAITPTVGSTDGTTTITSASLTISEIKIADVLDLSSPTVTMTNLSIDNVTGSVVALSNSTLNITANSISLFPGSTLLSGTVTSPEPTTTPAFDGNFDLSTGAFSATLQIFALKISSVLTANATLVQITYSPAAGSGQQIVSFQNLSVTFNDFGNGAITGSFVNLVIYGNGLSFDSATLSYTGTITVGSVLTLTNPSITLGAFSATFDGTNSSISASSLSVSVDSASVVVGSFTAAATSLTITVSLTDGSLNIVAGELDFQFATYLSLMATDITINTNPDANGVVDGAYLTVGRATATLSTGGTNPAFSVSGTASDFSIIDHNGTPEFQAGSNFGISFSMPSNSSLMLPTWLGFSISQFSISWSDFNDRPDLFTITLSASITSIQGLPDGVTVSGEVTDAVINMGLLEKGEFPITSIGSVGGSVSGTLFGMQVNASFVMGIVQFNAENQIVNSDGTVTQLITNPDGSVTEAPVTGTPDTTVKNSTIYVGVAGGATIPGVGGVQIYIGFSSLGPLTVYLSAEFPLILDPDTGLAIGGFSGGVTFDYTIPTPQQPTDLETLNLSPANISISQWQQQLRDQTVVQYTASSGGTNLSAAYSQPFVIEAGVTIYDAYLTANAFTVTGNIAIQINPADTSKTEIFVTGTATFGDNVSFNTDLFLNIDASSSTPKVTVMFLAQEPAGTPVEIIGGTLTFGFTDANGNPLPTTPVAPAIESEWIAAGTTYTATGSATVGNLAIGTYTWTPGANDFSLTVDGTTYYAFNAVNGQISITTTAANDTATLVGTSGTASTGALTASGSSSNLIAAGTEYVSAATTGTAAIGGLAGGTYIWTPGANDVSLTIGGTTYLASAAINGEISFTTTATGNSILVGTLNSVITGTLNLGGSRTNLIGANTVYNPVGEAKVGGLVAGTYVWTPGANDVSLTVGGTTYLASNAVSGQISFTTTATTTALLTGIGNTAISGTIGSAGSVAGAAYTITVYSPPPVAGGFYISLAGFVEYSTASFANVTISGGVTLTVTHTELKLDLLGMLNVSFLGDIATAQGEFVINYANSSNVQFYGAVEVSTGAALAKLQQYGLSADGAILFQINTTGVNQTVNLPNAPPANQTYVSAPQLNGTNSTPFTIQGTIIFDLTITGTSSPYATVSYEVNNDTLFQMQGFFDLRLTNDPTAGIGLEMFADVNSLTLGSGSNKFLNFSGFGLFIINSSGLAAEINLALNGGNTISGISFTANFQLVVNTTSQAVTFTVPSVTIPTSTSGSTSTAGIMVYSPTGSLLGTVTSLVIPAGPPSGSLAIIAGPGNTQVGGYASSGAAGPYVVISGVGSLSLEGLSLNGSFYFQVSDSSTGGFLLELVLNVSGSIPSVGTANVTGALQISSAGEVALLSIGGSGGSTTSYGSGISLQVSAELAINTTDSPVSEIGGVPLTYNGNNVTVAANSFQIIASGTLSLNIGGGTGFVISGTFSTTVTTSGGITETAITLNGTLTATVGGSTLLTMNAAGVLVVTTGGANPGMAAELMLTLAGSDPLNGNGFTFNGSFDLEVNTTGVQQIVNVNNSTTTITAGPDGTTNGGSYIEVHAHGNLVFGSATNGFQLQSGDFYLLIGSTGLAVSARAAMVIEVNGSQIFYAKATGALLINSSGIAASLTVSSTLMDPSGHGAYAFTGVFTLQANTTGMQQTVGTGQNAVTIAAGPGPSGSPAGPYFQLYVSGTLVLGGTDATAATGLFLTGSFYLTVSLSGINISANGTLTTTVDGSTLLTMTAGGGLIITTSGGNPGLAGELTLTFSAGNDPLAGNGFSFTGTFSLQINTTGTQQTVSVGTGSSATTAVISAGPNGSSVSGAYFEVDGSGTLIFGTSTDGFNLAGSFYLSVSTVSGLVVAADANFNAEVGGSSLLTMTASGVLIISTEGLAGELTLTLVGPDPLSGTGFSFNGTFGLEINTTLSQQSVTIGSGSSAITTTISAGPNGTSIAGIYFEVYASGSLIFGTADSNGNLTNGFGLTTANLYLSISPSVGLSISASAMMAIAIDGKNLITAPAAGAMLISSSGFAASIVVTATSTLTDPSGASLYAFGGTFTLQVNTTGVQQVIGSSTGSVTIPAGPGPNGIPAGPYFQMYVSGTLSLGTADTAASTGLFVAGSFYLSVTGTSLTISASGVVTVEVAGSTLFTMTAVGGLILTYGGPNTGLAGDLTLTVSGGSPLSGTGFSFNGSFNLQVNTTGIDQVIMVGSQSVTVTGGAGNVATGGAYFQISADGSILFGTTSTGFELTGTFFLSIQTDSNNLPVLFVSTSVMFYANIFGENLLTLNAAGAMEISSSGIAASFTLTANGGAPSLGMSGAFSFSGSFTFAINTTNAQVMDTVGSVTLNLAKGPYFEVAVGTPSNNATLSLGPSGSVLSLIGYFNLTISSSGLAVAANASLSLLGLINFTAQGALLITSTGIAAKLSLNLAGGGQLTGNNFSFNANFLLEINSTHAAVNTIAGVTVNLPGGPYFEVAANGSLVLGGNNLLSIMGSFVFTVSSSGIQFTVNASIDIFGFYFSVVGMAGFYSDGVALNIQLSLGGSNNPTVTLVPYVLALSGSFTLEVNTTGSSHFGIDSGTIFKVAVSATVNLFGFSIAQSSVTISYSGNVFTASGDFSLNFFNILTLEVYFYIDSGTAGSGPHYAIYAGTSIQLGSGSFNVHGSLTFEASNVSSATWYKNAAGVVVGYISGQTVPGNAGTVVASVNDVAFQITISGGVTAFGWNFASISATLSISSSYDVSVSVYVSVSFYFFSIGGTVHIDLGTIGAAPAPPPPPALGVVLNNPTIDGTSFTGTILLLDLGQYADANRGVPALPNEDYTITVLSTSGNTETVSVIAAGVYDKAVTYSGVTEIVAPNADFNNGTSNVTITITIGSGGTIPVVIFSGLGTNFYFLGGGTMTVNGTGGIDTVVGGSGDVTFNAGNGTSTFTGGPANNIINNDPGGLTVMESGYGSYDLNADVLTYGGIYSDTFSGPASIILTAPASGTANFTFESFDGANFAVTVNGNGNSAANVIFNYAGNIALSSVNVSSQTYGQIAADGGDVVLESIPVVTLIGSSAGDHLTVTNGADIPTINLQSAASDETFTVNLLGGIGYTVNVTGSGSDTLVVNGTNTNNTYNITSTRISLVNEVIKYSAIQTSILNAGGGSDTVNIQSISNNTTINLSAATNTINIGSKAPTESGGNLAAITAILTVNGVRSGINTVNVDDSGDNSSNTITAAIILTASDLSGSIFGTNGSLAYAAVGTLNIYLGNGAHIVDIQGMAGAVNVTLGNGINVLNIGSNAGPIVTDTNPADANTTLGNSTNTGSTLDQISGVLTFTGTGANTLNLDDSGSNAGVEGALTPTTITFLNTTTLTDQFVINLPTVAAINIALSQGGNIFAVGDTFTSASTNPVIVIDGNGGNDTFVILDTHAVMTINGGSGADQFYNFGNSSVLDLNGDAGDDTFYIYASVNENTSNLDPGGSGASGNQVYSYRQNAAVNIDGGTGYNTVYIFGTQYNDVITVNGNVVTGAGLEVNLTSVQNLIIEGLGGNDTFYIESITIPTTIYGDGSIVPAPNLNILKALNINVPTYSQGTPGSDTFYVGWQGASYIPGSIANFTAPLTIYGDNGPNANGTTTNVPGTDDTIYVNDTADIMDQLYTLTASMLTSTAFGTGGSLAYDSAVENLDIFTGNGDNTITVNGTGVATQTSIYGGNGNDTFIVNAANGGSLLTPLALFGGLNTFLGDTLTVNGAGEGNTFTITGFTIDGAGATISYEQMEQLNIIAGGTTVFNVNGDSIPTNLTGGSGDTTFNINSNVVSLDLRGGTQNNVFNINANAGMLLATGGVDGNTFTINGNSGTITITGGVGNDQFTINGNAGNLVGTGSNNPNNFVINANSGSLSLTCGVSGNTFTVNGNSGTLTLTGGSSADVFTVNSLSAAATLNGGTANDLFYVTGPLGAILTVNGGGDSGDLLTISGTAGNDFATVTSTTVTGIGAAIDYSGTNLTVNGISGSDTFIVTSTSSFITRINGGVFGNVFDIQGTTGALYVTGGMVGSNVFNLGSAAPVSGGTLAGLLGPVYITGGSNIMRLITLSSPGNNILNIDDSGDTVSNTGTLTSTALTGLSLGGGITYASINTLNIRLGLGVDTFNVQSTNLNTRTTLNTGPAADTVNVDSNSAAPGLTSGIQGALTIVGAGTDILNVNDAADTAGEIGSLTSTVLSGLDMGTSGITYSGVATLNIYLGLGNDTFNVLSTLSTASTTVNTGVGHNTVNVGSNAPATGGVLTGVLGGLTVVGSASDTLNVDDTGDTAGQSGILTSTTLTGLGLGAAGITYSGLSALNINLGSGNDTFTIKGITSVTATTINGGSGTNTAVINITGDFLGQNLTLLNFNTTSMTVTGNFYGTLNVGGAITTVTIGGSLAKSGVINAGSINMVTITGNLAGTLNVTGALGTLIVDGATPGQIVVGSVQMITVLAGYGNTLLNLTVNGIQREILALPVAGGNMPITVLFAFVYDATTSAVPQVAIRITNPNPVARSFNLELLVLNSSTAKFDLSLLDSTGNGKTGVANVSIQGDILTQLTAPELTLFTNLNAASRAGIVLPADSIVGVEVSGNLPIGYIDVAGIEGLAFSVLTTAGGVPISVTTPLGQGSSLSSLLGGSPVINPATDSFVVPFTQNGTVRLFVHDDTNYDFNLIMTLTAALNNNLPVVATVQVVPTTSGSINPLVQSVVLSGNGGGSITSALSIANITSTGPLGNVTITTPAGATVDNAPGLGNITAPSIFGSIYVTGGGIYGVIQTTSGDLGQVITGTGGVITGVTSISAAGAITGQIISRGNLISSISTGGAFSGVIAAQGDIGAIQRSGTGAAVTNSSNSLTRFGGISISGNDSGQIIALGNVFGNVTISGTMTGRMAVEGEAGMGLTATRIGILGNITIQSFAATAAITSGGLVGDAAGGTTVYLASPLGFVAAAGGVNLRSTTLPAGKLLANQTGANLSAISAIFTNSNLPLLFDTGGSLKGLMLIESDLTNIQNNSGTLSGTIP